MTTNELPPQGDSPLSEPPSQYSTPPVSPPPAQPAVTSTVRPSAVGRLQGMTWLLAVLVVLLILPSIAERIQYALTRGYQQARAEVARKLLAELPEPESRFSHVAMSIEPSVVGIETVRLANGQRARDEQAHLHGRLPEQTAGEGSGVIIDESGIILTNFHVIDRATDILVRLSDGRTIKAVTVVGVDPLTDLAVLKIEADGLTAAPWGDSEALDVGDQVLAIGNPYGLARTVTAGIISATERRGALPAIEELAHQDFLQTDAAVNPGNSGGPLVNLRGEVVGINTAIYGQSYRGISFAIPSKLAKDVYERLRDTGTVDRGWLGVAMSDVTEEWAEEFDWSENYGTLVTAVVPNSPAAAAGVEAEDIIVAWNGQRIADSSGLSLAVVRTKIDSKATLEVIRDGERVEMTVHVGPRPPQLRW